MNTTFLGQGFENSSVDAIGNYLIQYLNRQDFHSFIGISAFASEAGIFGLSGHIQIAKSYYKNLSLIVGIDQEGTSKEALEEILNLNIESFIFYQNESPIFHPKIYLFEGDKDVKLIIGSSNLTARGLFTNVESSLLIEFEITDTEGNALLTKLKSYYKTLFDFSDPNLFKISKTIIDDFRSKGIVPDERERQKFYSNKKTTDTSSTAPNPNDVSIPHRATAKTPASFPSKVRPIGVGASTNNTTSALSQGVTQHALSSPASGISTQSIKLVWESGPLSQRDLTIPGGANTNQTGSMLFKKGQTPGIDQRSYFRNQVFANLTWAFDTTSQRTAHIERATALFRIFILGVDHGVFPLSLSHNTKTNTPTYLQNNSMTSLSWGTAKNLIADPNLIGKSASLYVDSTQTNHFILMIN
ncbi:MAG: phospholipase D family protein [Saprospiraceae bacterium]|nr:phospholipase D family protein [Saprospiraceae bacterium]MBP6568551.1 phospholipase D family protein [Saprospiraceae bacterium]